jgi:hypothetical protein
MSKTDVRERICLAAFLLCASCTKAAIGPGDSGADQIAVVPDAGPGRDASPVLDVGQPSPDVGEDLAIRQDTGSDIAEDVRGDVPDNGSGGSPGMGGSGAGGTGAGGMGIGGAGVDAGVGGSGGTAPTPSVAGQLIFTEIMADSAAAIATAPLTSDDVGEWVELQNRSSGPLDLFGCALFDSSNTDVINAHLVVMPGDLVVLARSTPGFSADYTYSNVKFADAGDVARLSCGLVNVDVVDFRPGNGFTLMQGYSLSRDAAGVWCSPTHVYNTTSKGVDHGTPGQPNDSCGGGPG